jgi:hypothetical protein
VVEQLDPEQPSGFLIRRVIARSSSLGVGSPDG